SRRRHTRWPRDWSSDVCSSDLFARAALEERAQAAWPPFSRLAAVRDSATTAQAALGFLTDARSIARRAPRGVRLLGPVPAAMARSEERRGGEEGRGGWGVV